MPKFIIVDGLIAAGKTSLLSVLNKNFKNSKASYEPVDHWEETGNLTRFYNALNISDDQNRSAQIYRFQTYTFQTRIKRILEDLEEDKEIYFIERSIFSDRYIFMKMLKDSGLVTTQDYEMYKTWWDLWDKILPFTPDAFIYLNPTVDSTIIRYKKRNRSGEDFNVEYQKKLKDAHDDFFENLTINDKKVPVLNLNTDVDFREGEGEKFVVNLVRDFIEEITNFN